MKYSFIVPTYNSERWIQLCINSILAQTYTGFNIIILDSGSSDNTLQWLSSLNDRRIKIYPTTVRLDIVQNWQRAINVPRNEFMTIMGHDDILYPNYLNTINKLVESNPDAGLYQTHFNFIDADGKIIRAGVPMNKQLTPADFLNGILKNNIEITATGFMVRSKMYDEAGGIPPYPQLLYADTELWLKLILKSYLAVAPETCFEFRFHINNTSKSTGEVRLIAFEKMIDFFGELEKENVTYKNLIHKNGLLFFKSYVIGSCHKLIYIQKENRGDVTMNSIIASSKRCVQKLLPNEVFEPVNFPQIWLAKFIDSNIITRYFFLTYKSFQKRTF